jgi:hypothetical protein
MRIFQAALQTVGDGNWACIHVANDGNSFASNREYYGGHSADLLFHIIISELQYIIPDSSPKILSGRENYLLGAFIYWAVFIY